MGEQKVYMPVCIAPQAYVLETGDVFLVGPAKDLANNPEVQKAYLGE